MSARHGADRSVWFDQGTRTWIVSSFNAAIAVLTDRSFVGARPTTLETVQLPTALDATVQRGLHLQSLWLGIDRASHARIRPLATAALSPRSIAERADDLRQRATRLLDRMVAAGDDDFSAHFVRPFVNESTMDLFALPGSARGTAARCASELSGFLVESREAIVRAAIAQACMGSLFEELLAAPAPHSAPITHAVQQALLDDVLTTDEAVALLSVLLFAGLHTTQRALDALLLRLWTAGSLRDSLRTGAITMDALIEESLRINGPHERQRRTATRDVQIDDVVIAAGQGVLIDFHAVNHDASRFTRPEEFDPSRHDGDHLTFSAGLHRCIGRHFARMELKIAATAFMHHIPRLEAGAHPTSRLGAPSPTEPC